jgi:hypothetical protein
MASKEKKGSRNKSAPHKPSVEYFVNRALKGNVNKVMKQYVKHYPGFSNVLQLLARVNQRKQDALIDDRDEVRAVIVKTNHGETEVLNIEKPI